VTERRSRAAALASRQSPPSIGNGCRQDHAADDQAFIDAVSLDEA